MSAHFFVDFLQHGLHRNIWVAQKGNARNDSRCKSMLGAHRRDMLATGDDKSLTDVAKYTRWLNGCFEVSYRNSDWSKCHVK